MTIEIDNELWDEKRVRDLIFKLQAEIIELHQENDSLRNDIQSLVEYIYELKMILGDSVYKIKNQNAKYMLEKYMLDQYHESKTKPIRKKGIHPSLKR
jgi:FtsZ-binding cell division protein ZapB